MCIDIQIVLKNSFYKSLFFSYLFTFLLLSFSSCEQPSMVNPETGKADGEKVYTYYCTSCHGPLGDRMAGNAPDLSKSLLDDNGIRQMILYGSEKGMAAYQSMIKDEELDALVEHVKSLRN
jgi:mono/diheme cytochrome c family protein